MGRKNPNKASVNTVCVVVAIKDYTNRRYIPHRLFGDNKFNETEWCFSPKV